MGGFSFLFPAFLAGLAAVALPILIHLIHRKKSKVLPFSSLRFLRLVEKRIARRRRLEEYLVLLFRALALALLALGLASPVSRTGKGGRTAVARVLVLDDSMSMSLAPAGGPTLMERAKETARALLAPLTSRDSAALVPLHPGKAEPRLSRNISLLKEELRRRKATLGDTPLNEGIRRGLALLRGAAAAVKDLVILTDCQARAVREVRASRLLARLPKGARLFLASPREAASSNLTLQSVLVRPLPSSGRGHRVLVTVSNGSTLRASATLTLEVDGAARARRDIQVPPGGTVDLPFDLPDTGDRLRRGRALLSADELPADNQRWFLLPKRSPLPVLVISGASSSIPRLDPAFYLVRALGPGEESTLAPERVSPAEAGTRDLSSFGALVLADSAPLPAETALSIRKYMERGGGVLAFLGPAAEADTFSRILPGTSFRVGPVVGDEKGENRTYHLTALDRRHPALAPLFATSPPVRLGLAGIYRYRRLTGIPRGARVLARFSGGDPALAEIRAGRGRLLIFASTANPEWNDLAWRVSYVPLLHSLVHFLAPKGPAGEEEWFTERPLVLSWPSREEAPLEVVLSAGGTRRAVEAKGVGGGVEFPLGVLHEPGVAELELRGRGRTSKTGICVNVDPAEGNLERDPWKDFPGKRIPLDDPAEAAKIVAAGLEGVSLSDPLVVLALLFLLAEGLLAWKIVFGGGGE